jgi:hypothetical protein
LALFGSSLAAPNQHISTSASVPEAAASFLEPLSWFLLEGGNLMKAREISQ